MVKDVRKSGYQEIASRRIVEGCHGPAMLASRLFVLCCGLISIGHGLSFTCFGRVLKGLLVFSAAERITTTLGTVCHDNRACLGQLTILGDSWLGGYARGSVFRAGHLGLL